MLLAGCTGKTYVGFVAAFDGFATAGTPLGVCEGSGRVAAVIGVAAAVSSTVGDAAGIANETVGVGSGCSMPATTCVGVKLLDAVVASGSAGTAVAVVASPPGCPGDVTPAWVVGTTGLSVLLDGADAVGSEAVGEIAAGGVAGAPVGTIAEPWSQAASRSANKPARIVATRALRLR